MPLLRRTVDTPRHRLQLALGIAIVAGLAIAVQTTRSMAVAREGRELGVKVLLPVTEAGATAHQAAEGFFGSLFGGGALRAENEDLKRQIAELRVRQAILGANSAAEGEQHRAATLFPDLAQSMIPAAVVAPVPDGRSRRLWLGAGRSAGVEPGMAVVGSWGVVGTIKESYDGYSMVQLLTDSSSRWGGMSSASGEAGLLAGTGDPSHLEFRLERSTTSVSPGDRIVTSGQKGSVIPTGLVMGEVADIGFNRDGQRVAHVALPGNPEALKTVFVLPTTQQPWTPPAAKGGR